VCLIPKTFLIRVKFVFDLKVIYIKKSLTSVQLRDFFFIVNNIDIYAKIYYHHNIIKSRV